MTPKGVSTPQIENLWLDDGAETMCFNHFLLSDDRFLKSGSGYIVLNTTRPLFIESQAGWRQYMSLIYFIWADGGLQEFYMALV